jgi:CubicO group peptidase (beta-lactamase class C family)
MNKKLKYFPSLEWEKKEPEDLNISSKNLAEMEHEIKTKYKNINSVILLRNGFIVYEKYYNGYNINDTHHVASVTKSVVSALIGIAIDKGYIKSIDQKIIDFFPEYNFSGANFLHKRIINIQHILNMTAPFSWKTNLFGFEPLDRFRRQKNWINFILDILGKNGKIGKFQYSSVGVHLLSAIISKTTGMCSREFANKFLFEPTGMKTIPEFKMKSFHLDDVFGKNVRGWIHDPQGITIGGWGLTITPRDMARFGLLYLNNGKWENKQIISEEWIKNSTAMIPGKQIFLEKLNKNSANISFLDKYGYLWWGFEINKISGFTAAGSGGNHIFCIPDKNIILVIASKIVQKFQDRCKLLENFILPAISD